MRLAVLVKCVTGVCVYVCVNSGWQHLRRIFETLCTLSSNTDFTDEYHRAIRMLCCLRLPFYPDGANRIGRPRHLRDGLHPSFRTR